MQEIIAPFFVLCIGAALVAVALRFFSHVERRIIWLAFAAHLAASVLQVLIAKYYYGHSDMLTYYREGALVSAYLEGNFVERIVDVVDLLLQRDPGLPFYIQGIAKPTGVVNGISALLIYVFGHSIYAVCMVPSTLAFLGQLCIYRTFRDAVPFVPLRHLQVATLFVPSVVFWSSALLKETFALAGLGVAFLAASHIVNGKYVKGLALMTPAVMVISSFKPYVLLPLIAATGVWYYCVKTAGRRRDAGIGVRLLYLIIVVAVVPFLLLKVGEYFPRYALDNVNEQLVSLQELGAKFRGGSTYDLGSMSSVTFWPLALLTALFRPLLLESSNVMIFLNASEMTIFLVLLVVGVYRNGMARTIAATRGVPALMFCVVFTFLFALLVGIGTTNLGSLARYRSPMMPFYAVHIAALLAISRASVAQPRRHRRPRPAPVGALLVAPAGSPPTG